MTLEPSVQDNMPIRNGLWFPNLSIKQAAIANCLKRYLLASGPRRSGKSLGCCHRVIRHAVETDRGRIGIFTKTVKVAKDGGIWSDLVDIVIPEWINGDTGIRLVTPPKVDGQTRQLYAEISNRIGNKTRIVLNSLDFDGDIEEAIRGKRYSMIFFNELSNFRSRRVFDIAVESLRCVHLPYEAHQWISDTNPSDEGEESWIYKLWFGERADEAHPDPGFRDDLELIEVMIDDNPFLTERERLNLIATYRHDPDLFNRYIKGLWTMATSDSHFADVFRSELHVVGDCSALREKEWEVLLPEENCHELLTGWDLGSINHSVHIIEPWEVDGKTVYKVLDEVVIIGQKVGLGDVVEMVMEKMDHWEKVLGHQCQWRHWSDRSAFDHYRPTAEIYDYTWISNYSEGKIDLRAAPKFPNSIAKRIDTLRRLLFEDRLLISANCPKTIAMFRGLKKGANKANFIDIKSVHKHVLDSLSYPLLAESPGDLLGSGPGARIGKLVTMG